MLKLSYSKIAFCLIVLVTFGIILQQHKWADDNGYVFNDAKGYYAYLPASLIHHDWSFEQMPNTSDFAQTTDGRRYTKYTMGTAICQAPTFVLAYLFAAITHYPCDGFSLPFQVGIALSALIFLMISLWLARGLLLKRFSEQTTAYTLLIFFIGTNYLHYNTSYLSYSHIYSVCFILLFIRLSTKIVNAYSLKNAVLLGLSFGMMTLIRPVDGVFVLIPLLIHVSTWSQLVERLRYILFQNGTRLLISMTLAFSVWIPQLIYNHSVFGRMTINSYQGEGFFFLDPEFTSALFSFNNGWLIYSPLMIFSVIGLMISLKRKEWMWPVIFVLYVYVISAWWCWWYVGFGNRAFVNLGAFLLIPMAFTIEVLNRRLWTNVLLGLTIIGGITLNLFQNQQFENGAIHYESMTFNSYQSSWLRSYPTFEFFDLLEKYDTEAAINGINAKHKMVYDTVYQQEFQGDSILKIQHFNQYSGLYEFPTLHANTFIAEAWSDSDCQGLSLMLETKPLNDCIKSSYGITTVDQANDLYKMRVYYRFSEAQLACTDTIRAFFLNDPKLETNIHRVKVTALVAKDSLVIVE